MVQVGQKARGWCSSSILSRVAEFDALGAKVIGCSVDSKYSHLACTERDLGKLGFPLLSDMTREAVHDNDIGRNTEETLRVLQAPQTGEETLG
jgi:alkyl hydroperoxide reductase subunit AhpC